ncbi:MAG: TonB-dependent receptor [Archangium sp.]|nr:TonB-dependent receptor [Archangium sp.]
MLRLVLVLAMCGSSALAQTLTKPPTLLEKVEPLTPDGGVTTPGTVVMEVDLGLDGKVLAVKVVSGLSPELDAAAVIALKQFVFTPAEIDHQPAAVRIQYALTYEPPPPPIAVIDAGVPAVNLLGVLRTAGTREPIAAASITVGEQSVTSLESGEFELFDIPVGEAKVIVTAPGFERFEATETIRKDERTEVVYYVKPSGVPSLETIVRTDRERREVTQVKLTRTELRSVAGTQGDAFKVLQSLPGVARAAFGSGALVVRGSKSWDSRVYVDEISVPQLFHFAGLSATFNASMIESISFQPGNWGASYGRSIGGLVQAEVRSPSKTGLHGYIDVSTFDLSAMVELPVSKNWSISVAGRRGLADVVLPFAIKTFAPKEAAGIGFSLAPQYFDYQLRAERKSTSKSRLFISLYGSSDRYAFINPNPFIDPATEGNQGSAGNSIAYHRLTLGFDYRFSDRVTFTSRNSIGFDVYEQLGGATDIFYRGTQTPIQARERFRIEIPEAKLTLSTGLDVLVVPTFLDAQTPPNFKANQVPDPYVSRRLLVEQSTSFFVEPAVFAEATWKPVEALSVIGGVRADYESYMKKFWVDPRLSVLWTPVDWLTVKGGAALYHQPPDYRVGQLSPVFGNPGLLPEGASHFTVGAETRFTDAISLDVNVYYKDLFSQVRQVLSSGLGTDINIPGVETRFSSEGYGRTFGAELLLRHKLTKNFFGWIAYSLSRFERDGYGPARYRPGPLDQPHNLIVVASYKLPFDIVVGGRFRFASGPLITPVVASLYDVDGNYYYPLPGIPWSVRLPDFIQLDVRIDKRFVFDNWVLALYLDIQNVTNQKNPEGLFYSFNYAQKAEVNGLPFFPSLGIRGEL